MSGIAAAISAYSGTGTQSYSTTNEFRPGVVSSFWNENDTTKRFVNGSCYSKLTNTGQSENAFPGKPVVVFNVDNDIDAINNLYLSIETSTTATAFEGGVATESSLFDLVTDKRDTFSKFLYVERIEICIGNSIICTMDKSVLLCQYRKGFTKSVTNLSTDGTIATSVSTVLLPIFENISKECNFSFLNACAFNQNVQIKVYTVSAAPSGVAEIHNIGYNIHCNKILMTNPERNILKTIKMPKRLGLTQVATVDSGILGNAGNNLIINCDYFNLDAKNIYIIGILGEKTLDGDNTMVKELNKYPPVLNFELLLNSVSFSGEIDLRSLVVDDSKNPSATGSLQSISGIGAPSSTLPALLTPLYCYSFAQSSNFTNTNESFVPLSRFNSIRIKLSAVTPHFTTISSEYQSLSIICEGNATALYNNGSVVFNNY